MPKAELLDPQGKATTGALARLGHEKFENVRIGKRFEFQVAGEVTDAVLAEVRQVADDILSNGVIEDVVAISVDGVQVSADAPAADARAADALAGEAR